MVIVLALILSWPANAAPSFPSSERFWSTAPNEFDLIRKTLLCSTQGRWPTKGVLITHCRTQANTLVVQVSKIDKRKRSFSCISEDMLLLRDSYSEDGALINRDRYRLSREAGLPGDSLKRIVKAFCALPVAKSLFQNAFELTVVSNPGGFQALAELTTGKPGDWVSVMFDKQFRVKRQTTGY